jgi:hypothetical protein
VLLDDAERAAAELAQLLGRWTLDCPQATFLVTSREVLRIGGEVVVPLGPLPGSEAVALFERGLGEGALPGYDSKTIGLIVEHLDRIPLAIEMACAWTDLLEPESLAARLGPPGAAKTPGEACLMRWAWPGSQATSGSSCGCSVNSGSWIWPWVISGRPAHTWSERSPAASGWEPGISRAPTGARWGSCWPPRDTSTAAGNTYGVAGPCWRTVTCDWPWSGCSNDTPRSKRTPGTPKPPKSCSTLRPKLQSCRSSTRLRSERGGRASLAGGPGPGCVGGVSGLFSILHSRPPSDRIVQNRKHAGVAPYNATLQAPSPYGPVASSRSTTRPRSSVSWLRAKVSRKCVVRSENARPGTTSRLFSIAAVMNSTSSPQGVFGKM